MLSTQVDSQCDKLVTVIGHQFITLTVDICVQHGGREAQRRAGLSVSAAAETCKKENISLFLHSLAGTQTTSNNVTLTKKFTFDGQQFIK